MDQQVLGGAISTQPANHFERTNGDNLICRLSPQKELRGAIGTQRANGYMWVSRNVSPDW